MTQATTGIASLIERIKRDGVQAGETERDARIESARKEAEAIVAAAQRDAEKIRKDAEAAADKRRAQLEAELRMAARDFAFRLQERISAQVIAPVANAAAAEALADAGAVAELVRAMVGSSSQGAEITADPGLRDKLVAALGARIGEAADKGGVALVDEVGAIGFRLKRAGEHFVWDVSAEAVARELSRLVEPSLRAALAPDKPRPSTGKVAVASEAAAKGEA